MRSRRAVVLLALALCFCGRTEPTRPAAPTPAPAAPEHEAENLLNIARGAAIVSRTGELALQQSAVALIDGDATTPWTSPPGDHEQTIVIALPARAAIDEILVATSGVEPQAARGLRIEASRDGSLYEPVVTASLEAGEAPQAIDTPPFEAAFLRLMPLATDNPYIQIHSVIAKGRLTGEPAARDIAGCWTINGREARFETDGARVRGVWKDNVPMYFEGGTDGRIVRLSWVKGPQFGDVAITLDPQSRSLSGMLWHEVPVTEFFGAAWFGERRACSGSSAGFAPDGAGGVLDRLLAYSTTREEPPPAPLYGLRFDARGNLDASASRATLAQIPALLTRPTRVVSREYRLGSEDANRAMSEARLNALRAELTRLGVDVSRIRFEAAGTATPRVKPQLEITRDLYSVVSLERP